MNYKRIYDDLMQRGQTRSKNDGIYYESHHIYPRCLGGTNEKTNLTLLTPEEHYVAHQLLVKMHPSDHKLLRAATFMSAKRTNNKTYGWLRRKLSTMMVENNPNKNGAARRKWISENGGPPIADSRNTEESLHRLSERMKLNNPIHRLERHPNSSYVLKIDPETNEIVQKYDTMKEARIKENLTSTIFYKINTNSIYKGFLWKRTKQ